MLVRFATNKLAPHRGITNRTRKFISSGVEDGRGDSRCESQAEASQ
jgi:hypothetical protein